MPELFDPRNLAFFARPGGATFGAFHGKPSELTFGSWPAFGTFHARPSELTCGSSPAKYYVFTKGSGCRSEWNAEKTPPVDRKIKRERFYTFSGWTKEGVAFGQAAVMEVEEVEEEVESPLDKSLVARYHELSALGTQGRLSAEQKAELAEVQRQLDDQEQGYARRRSFASDLDADIERLKKMIELNHMVTPLL